MSNSQPVPGGLPGAGRGVWTDPETLDGNGTKEHPLRVIGGDRDAVIHDASLRGDGTLASPLAVDSTIPFVNGDSTPLEPGMPVAMIDGQAMTVVRGDATNQARAALIGMVTVGADRTLIARVKAIGVVQLTAAQWDARTGGSGGLVPGASYFLAPTPGGITTTPPSSPGMTLIRIGSAIDHERFAVSLSIAVLL